MTDNERHYIMIKALVQEQEKTIVNIYASNTWVPQELWQTLRDINGVIDNNTITVGEFNTPLTSTDRPFRQKNQ